jgi:hypothetical protein
MKPEQQRIAIAEVCGWTEIEPCTCCDGVSRGYTPTPGAHKKHLPDYCNDLNAMHDAEKVLIGDEPENSELWCDFQTNLVIACPAYLSYHATASQRAEAFLRTIGKWEEAKP